MRKLLYCLLAIIILLSACQKSSPASDNNAIRTSSTAHESTASSKNTVQSVSGQSDDEYYYATPENTIVSDDIVFGASESTRNSLPSANLKESYVFTKSLNSGNIFYWDYELYLPRFTDEISYDGAETIKSYYEDMADSTAERINQIAEKGFDGDRISKSFLASRETPYSVCYFTYSNYSASFIEPYLTVTFGSYVYLGGAHGFDDQWCDNFDMRSGKKLSLEDIFIDIENDAEFLNEYMNNALDGMFGDKHTEIDIMEWYDQEEGFHHAFRLTEEGVQILFGSYETGPYGYGMPEVTLPYSDIQSIIKIDIPK